jgi:hypothetical protein
MFFNVIMHHLHCTEKKEKNQKHNQQQPSEHKIKFPQNGKFSLAINKQ